MMGELDQAGRRGPGSRVLDAMLPHDHLLRRIDRVLDLTELRGALASHYSRRGRPSIAPELLIRMALIGRIYAITSERRLCEELRYNLAYRWFCGLAVGAPVPHHSTFSKNRYGRFREAGVFRLLFEITVRRCMAAGLVSGKDAAIDASFVAADASWQRKLRDGDLAARPQALPRPVRDWISDQAAAPEPTGRKRCAPAEVSRTDPAAAWSVRPGRGRFGYALNVLMDAPGGVAVEVEAGPARLVSEVDAGRTMLIRAAERFTYHPKRVTADTAYGSARFLAFVRDQGAQAHIPVLERSELANGMFPLQAFTFDPEQDQYTCPNGKILVHRGLEPRIETHRYGARRSDCGACPLRSACTEGPARRLTRMVDEDARNLARAEMRTDLFKRSMRLRRGIERLFGDAKGRRGLSRLHLRGQRGAEEEFLIAAAVLNLMLLARPSERTRRPGRPTSAPHSPKPMERVSRDRFGATPQDRVSLNS